MVRIMIVDDHPLVIDGIRTMLMQETWIELVTTSKNISDARTFFKSGGMVDLILLDINLPDGDGISYCEEIKAQYPGIKVIALTYLNEAAIINQIIRKGANGYLLKSMERSELFEAINKVMNDELFLSKEANAILLQMLKQYDLPPNKVPVLTRREKEIIDLLSEGLTSIEIANKLFLSNYTVDTHRKNMLQKFNVHNTQSLLKAARELGVLS